MGGAIRAVGDTEMAECVGFPVPGPEDKVFAAMDYHLSWLHAALSDEQPRCGDPRKDWRANVALARDGLPAARHAVENNQEDVDFILAYEHRSDGATSPTTFVILVEAKGVTSFHEKQNASKLPRLAGILRHAHTERSGAVGIPPPAFKAALLYLSPGSEPPGLLDLARAQLTGAMEPGSIQWQPLHLQPHDPAGFWWVRLDDRDRQRWSIARRSGGRVASDDTLA
jgi:hypothetical protein